MSENEDEPVGPMAPGGPEPEVLVPKKYDKFHIGGVFTRLCQTSGPNVVLRRTKDGLMMFEGNEPFKLEAKGDMLEITGDGSEESVSVNSRGMICRGNVSIMNVNGKTTINGVSKEEFMKKQKKRSMETKDDQNTKWTFGECKFSNVNVASSGNMNLGSQYCLATTCKIKLAGSGNLTFHNKLFKELHMVSNGSGDISTDGIQAEELYLEITSSGDINMDSCHTTKLKLRGSGSGDFTLGKVTTTNADIQLHSSGDCNCDGVIKTLNMDVYGSGDGHIRCKLQTAKLTTYSSGDITGFTVMESVVAESHGSGDISGKISPTCKVQRSATSSGDIKLRK